MNILIEQLPDAVEIDGQEVAIHSDFRVCLRVILAFEDNDLTTLEKQLILLDQLYPVKPDNLAAAFEMGLRFLNGGEEGAQEKAASPRLYSFEQDAALIFAAFRQTHSIDLETAQLHWWKFMALFMDLGAETTFCSLVSLRQRVKSGKATPEERAAALEMGEVFDVPELDDRNQAEREREAEFLRLIEMGKKNGV